jgi:hypothetical protein
MPFATKLDAWTRRKTRNCIIFRASQDRQLLTRIELRHAFNICSKL